MRSMLCVAMAALVLVWPTAGAPARAIVLARTKCVGLYCAIVAEPGPKPAPGAGQRRRALPR